MIFSAEKRLDSLPTRKYGAAEIVDNDIYFIFWGIPSLLITSRIDFARYRLFVDANKLLTVE